MSAPPTNPGEVTRVVAGDSEAQQSLIDQARDARGEAPEEQPAEAAVEQAPEEDVEETAEEQAEESGDDQPEYALDFEGLFNEVAEHGGLTEESAEEVYKVLDDAKLPRDLLPVYLEGLRAINQNLINTAYSAAGGEEQYQSMVAWAREGGFNPQEIAAYDAAVQSGPEQARFAVESLASRFRAAGGPRVSETNLSTRSAPRASAAARGNPIMSRAELAQATADPRYRSDPAYRADVQARVQAGMASGEYRQN